MKKFIPVTINTVAATLLATSVHAAVSKQPVMLNGTYQMFLDRAKQTFNGHLVTTDRPSTQTENFTTSCTKSGCIAHSVNKRPPPPTFDYRWVNGHWESVPEQQKQFLICNDGSKVDSIKYDTIVPNEDGTFSGERTIVVKGQGCPGDGPGKYWLPFTLTPAVSN
jgi:hypothetical protein